MTTETVTVQAPRLPSFRELRELAGATPGIKGLIKARAFAMSSTGWSIDAVPGQFPARRDLERLFSQPSPDYPGFTAWLGRITEDLIVCDAGAVCLRTAGGVLSLDLTDPATVEPAVDRYGRLQGFMQYSGEVPRRDFAEMTESPPPGVEPWFGLLPARFIYLSFSRRRWTPMGFSPLEQAIVRQEDGSVDLAATEERLQQTADGEWAARCMDWLAEALFGRVLERIAPGARWKWGTGG